MTDNQEIKREQYNRLLTDVIDLKEMLAVERATVIALRAEVVLSSEQHERTLDEVETLTTQLVAEADRADRAEKDAERLALALTQVRINHHYECDDPWYSCPQAESYVDGDRDLTDCDCGKEENNRIIDEALAAHKKGTNP